MTTLVLSAIQLPLLWMHHPLRSHGNGKDELTITAGPKTDMFIDPSSNFRIENEPRLMFETQEKYFKLSAKVSVDFASKFDAGCFIIWEDEENWAKLAFENSPDLKPMVVSVVTREFSDDANSEPIAGNEVHLRVSRLDQAWAFHFSRDGHRWELARLFRLRTKSPVSEMPCCIGFGSQSPTGEGCTTSFKDIKFVTEKLADPRNGE